MRQLSTLMFLVLGSVPLTAQADIASFLDPGLRPRDVACNAAATRAVAVDDTGNVRVYDLVSGVELSPAAPIVIGATLAPDAVPVRHVVCSATRAVVFGFDLSSSTPRTRIAVIDIASTPFVVGSIYQSASGLGHDIALAPSEQYAAINGSGAIWFVHLSSARVHHTPTAGGVYPPLTLVPLPRSILATDRYVLAIRNTGPQGVVHIYDPTDFVVNDDGVPVGGVYAISDMGAPFDLDLSPDRSRAIVVTTGPEQFLFDLTLPLSMMHEKKRFASGTTVLDGYRIQDSVELTNQVGLVTRILDGGTGRVEVFDLADPSGIASPVAGFDLDGWPHDVDATPSGAMAVVTSHERSATSTAGVLGLNLPSPAGATVAFALPSGGFLTKAPFDYVREVSESVRVTDTRAVVIANDATVDATTARVRVLGLGAAPGSILAAHSLAAATGGGPAFDLEFSTEGERAAVAVEQGNGLFLSLATGRDIGVLSSAGDLASTPIANALVLTRIRALTIGLEPASTSARSRLFDTCSVLPMSLAICPAIPGTTGQIATLSATGSTSIAANDLVLAASGLSPGAPSQFFCGPVLLTPPAPIATGGTSSIGAPVFRFALQNADANGMRTQIVDLGATPLAGQIQPGETWWFQLFYRNVTATTTSNTSDVIQVTFAP